MGRRADAQQGDRSVAFAPPAGQRVAGERARDRGATQAACASSPASQSQTADAGKAVHGAIHGLPVEQRQAIELAFFGGLSHVEIADRLSIPVGTIKARIRRGMLALRDRLEGNL